MQQEGNEVTLDIRRKTSCLAAVADPGIAAAPRGQRTLQPVQTTSVLLRQRTSGEMTWPRSVSTSATIFL